MHKYVVDSFDNVIAVRTSTSRDTDVPSEKDNGTFSRPRVYVGTGGYNPSMILLGKTSPRL